MQAVIWLIISIGCLTWIVANYIKLLQIRSGKRSMVLKQNAPLPMEWEVEILDFLKQFDRISAAKEYAIKMGRPHWIKSINKVIKMKKIYLIETRNNFK